MCMVCSWKEPDGASKIDASRNHYPKCLSSHYQSYPFNQLKLIDWNFKWVFALLSISEKKKVVYRVEREVRLIELKHLSECDASFFSSFSLRYDKSRSFFCCDLCCEEENTKLEKMLCRYVDRKRTRWKCLRSNLGIGCVQAMSKKFPPLVFQPPPKPSFITDLMKKSPAKALFRFFSFSSDSNMWTSHTSPIPFHPLTRFIFVYVIRKEEGKLYTELVEFPFSLDYTNSNLFNFPYFSPFPSLSLLYHFSMNSQNTFRTPVYTTSKRRNAMGVGLVFEADLGTTEHVNRWVLQGVCLTLNDDWLTDDAETSFSSIKDNTIWHFLYFIFAFMKRKIPVQFGFGWKW